MLLSELALKDIVSLPKICLLLTALYPLHAVGGCAQSNVVTGTGWSSPENWGRAREIAQS